MEFPHPLGDANPLLRRLLNRRLRAGGAQETVSQIAYSAPDGGPLPLGEQCAFAVDNCVAP